MSTPSPHPDPQSPWHSRSEPPSFGTSRSQPVGGAADDPLVPPPDGGLSAIWERLNSTLRRSGGTVAKILLITFALPQIGWALLLELTFHGLVTSGGMVLPNLEQLDSFTGGLLLALLVSLLALSSLMAWGWAAAIWAITEGAVAPTVTVREALAAGARRFWPMFGWYLLYLLMVMVGLMLCVLPGLYLAVAGSLFSFAVMYERGDNPMARSFRLLHQSFGQVVGRVALVLLFMVVSFCALAMLLGIFGIDETAHTVGARMTGNVVDALVTIGVYLVMLVALLLTYTQARARQAPLSTGELQAAVR